MTKIFELDFRKGSEIERYNKYTPSVYCPLIKTDKGLAISSIQSVQAVNFAAGGIVPFGSSNWSVEFYALTKPGSTAGSKWFFGQGGSSTQGVQIYNSAANIPTVALRDSALNVCSISANTAINLNVWNHHVITCNRSGNITYYLNGVAGTPGSTLVLSGTLTNTAPVTGFMAYAAVVSADTMNGYMSFFRFYNTVLTQPEIDKLQAEAIASKPVTKPKRGFIISKPTDLSTQVNKDFGIELIPDPYFANSAVWNKQAGVTVTGGKALFDNVAQYEGIADAAEGLTFVVGQSITMTVNVESITTGGLQVYIAGSGAAPQMQNLVVGLNIFNITTAAVATQECKIRASLAGTTAVIKSFSVKQRIGLIAAYNMTQKNGVVTDISGNNLTGTIGGNVISSMKGLSSPLKGCITCPSLSLDGDFSISWRMKMDALGTVKNIFRLVGSGTSNIWIFITAVSYLVVDQNSGGSYSVANGSSYEGEEATLTMTFVSSTHTTQFYKNGVALGASGTTYNPSGSRTAIFNMLGINATEATYTGRGELQDLRIYNKILSLQEIKDYHNLFVKPSIAEDFSDQPASNTNIVPTGWQQISGTTKVGEVTVAKGELITTFSLAGSVLSNVTATGFTHTYVGGSGVKDIAVISTSGSYNGIVGHRYITKFTLTINSGSMSSPIKMSAMGVPFQDITVGDNVFNIISSNGANGTYITVSSTSDCNYTISNFSMTDLDPSPTVKQGTKYLEQVTAGQIVIPSNTAYGTWEWDYYKGDDANVSYFQIISTNNSIAKTNGYVLYPISTEAVYFAITNAGDNTTKFNTSINYLTNKTWYRFRVTRSHAGVFTALIKGGTMVPTAGYDGWRLVGTATDTTHKSSNYMLLDMDAGDRTTNLVITNNIKQ